MGVELGVLWGIGKYTKSGQKNTIKKQSGKSGETGDTVEFQKSVAKAVEFFNQSQALTTFASFATFFLKLRPGTKKV